MNVGIGLPVTIPGVSGERGIQWAKKADAGPFSSLGIIDRIAYPNHEPLIALAAAASVTQRVRLMTTVLLAPLRNTGVLAKQIATLDQVSDGRLTIGLGVGGRPDDYAAAPASFHDRGKRLEEQLALMKRIWAGEPAGGSAGPVGPPPRQPGGPEILIGASARRGIQRVGRWADGFITGGAPPDAARQLYSMAEESWKAEGRTGRPRLVGGVYYALGPGAAERGAAYIRDYYAFAGQMAEGIAQSILSTPEAVKGAIQAYADIGMDELVMWPTVPDLDQVDRLAELVG